MGKSKDTFSAKKRRAQKKQEHEFTRRRLRKSYGPGLRIPFSGAEIRYVQAPEKFSLIQNAEETIAFLNRLESLAGKTKIFVKFDRTRILTPDAAMALVATINKLPGGTVRGDVPPSTQCKAILIESGFFEFVKHGLQIQASNNGRIARRTSKQVEGALAEEMILLGTGAIHGNPIPSEASYRVLVEAMQNTRDHARKVADNRVRDPRVLDTETWWAMVYADTVRRKVCFAFLDTGVGIFRSARIRLLRKLFQVFRDSPDLDVLKDILEGRLGSSTGLSHRGKGLPAMKELSDGRQIERFTVISNGVYAAVEAGSYTGLSSKFSGTLLYWEV